MKLAIQQIDAFSNGPFTGNPAAVIVLEDWLSDELMQQIAEENNLAETAFVVPRAEYFDIRWFTPTVEVRLCGHATLASAFVLFESMDRSISKIRFESKSGALYVSRNDDMLTLDFPTDEIYKLDEIPNGLPEALGHEIDELWRGQDDLLAICNSEEVVQGLRPDFKLLSQIESRGVIVTARGENEYDFVSRGFFPQSGIDEDPATGSAHTTLTPFWSKRIGKNEMSAKQLSKRGGYFYCKNNGNRTLISGKCTKYLEGTILI